MKVNKIIYILLITALLMGCKNKDKTQSVIEPEVDKDIVPIDDAGSTKDENLPLVPIYIVNKMSSYESYESHTNGQTVAKALFVTTNQKIDAVAIKDKDYSYSKSVSESSLANSYHEAYFHNEITLGRDKGSGDFTKRSLADYLSIYGTYSFDSSIEGYLVSEGCVTSVTKLETENSHTKFKLTFDIDKATNNVKIQMAKQGGLNEPPKFSKIEMVVEVTTDFTLVTNTLHAEYKVKKGFNADCTQDYVVTYLKYNEQVEIPDLDKIKPLFN